MEYDVDYLIDKFDAIPESMFITGVFQANDGREIIGKCSIGHTGVRGCNETTAESIALKKSLKHLVLTRLDGSRVIDEWQLYPLYAELINDKKTIEYQQPTAKQRIVAALRDAKKLEESLQQAKDIVSELMFADIDAG